MNLLVRELFAISGTHILVCYVPFTHTKRTLRPEETAMFDSVYARVSALIDETFAKWDRTRRAELLSREVTLALTGAEAALLIDLASSVLSEFSDDTHMAPHVGPNARREDFERLVAKLTRFRDQQQLAPKGG